MKSQTRIRTTWLRLGLLASTAGVLNLSADAVEPGAPESSPPASSLTLWYRHPAKEWTDALPVGNGRLGAMVFGGITNERIQLNEGSIWSASGGANVPPGSGSRLPEIRALLFEGKYAQGEALAKKELLSFPGWSGSYQTLGDLWLSTSLPAEATDYRRSLDLDTGVACTSFKAAGVNYRREVLASVPEQLLVVRLTADQPGKVSFCARLERTNTLTEAIGGDTLVMTNTGDAEGQPPAGVRFAAALMAVRDGGKVTAGSNQLEVVEANSVTLLVSAVSDYNLRNPQQPISLNCRAIASNRVKFSAHETYATMRQRSIDEHHRLFRRVDLNLSPAPPSSLPTDERLGALKGGADDPHLFELYFQYGRYLLQSCSRPGGLPSNLQGLWNRDMQAPWGADYHININIQMNYWPAEVCNLSECHEPLFDFIESLAANSGRQTAQNLYGARGFVGHFTTDAWLMTPASGQPKWALWQMGGAWCSRHFMEHYWYTGDRQFLKARAYPMLREASLFLLDWLTLNPKTGKLVSGPSASPENEFLGPDGKKHSVSMGDSMDQEIVWDTFNNFLAAARELNISDSVTTNVQSALGRLAWPGIASDRRLMEWAEEFTEPEPGHRHISHLYGLHPGYQFTQNKTPEYTAAARKTIDYRLAHGGGHTGWSRAWIVNFWARFHDGEQAWENLRLLLQKSTLNNLFDTHPPFQIDGNFGGTAGIAEMLLQSHQTVPDDSSLSAQASRHGEVNIVELLPALPKAWATGRFRGLRARGGFEVGVYWKDGVVEQAEIRSLLGKRCLVKFGEAAREFDTQAGKLYTLRGAKLE